MSGTSFKICSDVLAFIGINYQIKAQNNDLNWKNLGFYFLPVQWMFHTDCGWNMEQ